MKDLLILGSGVHACEIVEIVERVNKKNKLYNLLGFVSGDYNGDMLLGYPVYSIEDLEDRFSHAVLVPDNTYDLEFKKRYRHRMVTIIDPSCFVSKTAKIGQGCVLYPGCFVGFNAIIQDFVFCLSGSIINHDDVIGAGSILASGVKIAGNVTIGEEVYLGQGCAIKQMLNIGNNSLVGTGAVVIRDVPSNTVVVGNPARILRSISK